MSKRDELAEKHYKESGWVPTEWAVMNFHAGYDAAKAEALKTMDLLRQLALIGGMQDLADDYIAAYKKD